MHIVPCRPVQMFKCTNQSNRQGVARAVDLPDRSFDLARPGVAPPLLPTPTSMKPSICSDPRSFLGIEMYLDPCVGDGWVAVRRTLQHQLHAFDDDISSRSLPHHRPVYTHTCTASNTPVSIPQPSQYTLGGVMGIREATAPVEGLPRSP